MKKLILIALTLVGGIGQASESDFFSKALYLNQIQATDVVVGVSSNSIALINNTLVVLDEAFKAMGSNRLVIHSRQLNFVNNGKANICEAWIGKSRNMSRSQRYVSISNCSDNPSVDISGIVSIGSNSSSFVPAQVTIFGSLEMSNF